jgi:glycosyltransferase involved in cell wall biosynthesis
MRPAVHAEAVERRPLRIAFIGGRGVGSKYSGIETYYEELGARLVARGHEVVAYCRRHATPADTDFRGIVPLFRPCWRSKHGETFTHTLVSTLDVLFRRMDIVQFHALGPSLFSGVPRLSGARTVASIRGLDWQREKWGTFATRFLRMCEAMSHRLPDAVSVVSRTLAGHYRERHGVDVVHIPNGVTIRPAPAPREIAALGLLIEAHRAVAGQAKLVLAGGSSYTDGYGERLRRTAPPDVIFPGVVGGRLRDELYAHAAAFVLPSTIEGLSIALLEAMAWGSCVVASDIPENRELVEGVGMLVPPRDPVALGAALARVFARPGEARALGRRARQRVEAEYTWDEVAARTEAFYYDVLERPRRRP